MSGRRDDVLAVPPADFRSYYGRPVVRAPVWKGDIVAYLFTGGLAAGSSLLAAGADATGRPGLRRSARLTAAAALAASAGFLVHDLGRPSRFANMLRVFKPTSPMSMGTWILAAYGPAASLAAVAEAAVAEAAPALPAGAARRVVPGTGRAAGWVRPGTGRAGGWVLPGTGGARRIVPGAGRAGGWVLPGTGAAGRVVPGEGRASGWVLPGTGWASGWVLPGSGRASRWVLPGSDAARRVLPRAGRASGWVAAGLAPLLATYTAVLLADTAVPAWHEARRLLPFVFAGSALASGAGAGLLLAPIAETGPARRMAVAGAAVELAGVTGLEHRLGLQSEAYRSPAAARPLRMARALTVAGAAGAALGRGRALGAVAGVALLAGSACTRAGVYRAGIVSAQDPRYTILPQRERVGRSVDQRLDAAEVTAAPDRDGS